MKFAVIADIHGNAPALRAVLAEMHSCGVSQAVNLGDHLSGPIDPAGTAALLAAQDFPSIAGNHDRWLLTQTPDEMGPTDRVAHEALSPAALAWLRALPGTCEVFDGVFACHGTPRCDLRYWLDRVTPAGDIRAATLAEVAAEAEGISAGLILCAHTHLPRVVHLPDGRMVLNPGSVGCPAYDDDQPVYHRVQTGTPNASYALVEGQGRDWRISLRSVPYDHHSAARMAQALGRDDWARALATGWYGA